MTPPSFDRLSPCHAIPSPTHHDTSLSSPPPPPPTPPPHTHTLTVLIVVLFFFTTPAIVLASVEQIQLHIFNVTVSSTHNAGKTTSAGQFVTPCVVQSLHQTDEVAARFRVDPLVRTYLANLLLLLFASLLPFCVSRSSYIEAHWTRCVCVCVWVCVCVCMCDCVLCVCVCVCACDCVSQCVCVCVCVCVSQCVCVLMCHSTCKYGTGLSLSSSKLLRDRTVHLPV